MSDHSDRSPNAPRTPRSRSPRSSPPTQTSLLMAWLELARLSNAPTVASNALVGAAIATVWSTHHGSIAQPQPWEILTLVISMVAMYAAGMMLNDWFDLDIDRRERPSRALPSGRIAPSSALNAAIALMGGGVILACLVQSTALPWVLLLAAAIISYDMLHARAWIGVPLMALCRALAIAVPALALTPSDAAPWKLLLWFAPPLALYVALVSIIARREVGSGGSQRWMGALLLLPALAPLGALTSGLLPPLTEGRILGLGFVGGALVSWIIRAQLFATPLPPTWVQLLLPGRLKPGGVRIPRAIMAWIGAIALVDAMSLILLGEPGLAVVAVGLFFLATVSHIRIAGS